MGERPAEDGVMRVRFSPVAIMKYVATFNHIRVYADDGSCVAKSMRDPDWSETFDFDPEELSDSELFNKMYAEARNNFENR